jgi:SulP family sulfate permease
LLQKLSSRLPAVATGLRSAWSEGYELADLRKDVMAGLTVGTIAVPLSMALAIATGVPPQHGLYTAIVAGALIALTGGSRFSVSGPTAAFVAILFPIVQQFGLGGLLVASMMAGLILVTLGLTRMGAVIQYVPYPVVVGFTAGIAVVIAVLQVPDFFGLQQVKLDQHFLDNVAVIATSLPSFQPLELGVGAFTLAVMILWPHLKLPIPAPLAGLAIGALAAYALSHWLGLQAAGGSVETIATRFSWELNGQSGPGIPPVIPSLVAPWHLPGPDGQSLRLDFALIQALAAPAFAIAFLGAIESLLCAVVADGLTKTRHDPNSELIGQGIGNLVAPLFGGITATAAIARTAANIRSGARSPVAAIIHAGVVLLAVMVLAPLLGMVPMAALAALLFTIAWNMSHAHQFVKTLRSAPPGDVTILLVCFFLTVLFDMVLAVAVGVGLAAALFIRRMSLLTNADQVDNSQHPASQALPDEVAVYDVNGPLFFGAAEKAMTVLHRVDPNIRTVIIDMVDVPSMDGTAIVALESLIDQMRKQGTRLILVGLKARIIVKLRRAGLHKVAGSLTYCQDMEQAAKVALRWQAQAA